MDLDELRWHWGSAYALDVVEGAYRAIRKDNGSVLLGSTVDELHASIITDYQSQPVPRR